MENKELTISVDAITAKATASDNQMFTVNPNDPELNLDAISGDYEVQE